MKRTEYIAEEVSKMIMSMERRMMSHMLDEIQLPPAQLLALLFICQSDYLVSVGSSVNWQFEEAKKAYLGGEYKIVQKRLERLIGVLAKTDSEQRKLLAESHLLLGAAYEKNGEIREAQKHYKKARKLWKKTYHSSDKT